MNYKASSRASWWNFQRNIGPSTCVNKQNSKVWWIPAGKSGWVNRANWINPAHVHSKPHQGILENPPQMHLRGKDHLCHPLEIIWIYPNTIWVAQFQRNGLRTSSETDESGISAASELCRCLRWWCNNFFTGLGWTLKITAGISSRFMKSRANSKP